MRALNRPARSGKLGLDPQSLELSCPPPPRSYVVRLGPFTPDLKAGELHKAGYRLLVPVERKEAGPAAPNTGGRRAEQRSARAERCSALHLTCCLPSRSPP